MLQEEHIRKEVRNKISSNTIMSGWSKQQGIAYSLSENQKKYDKRKDSRREDGERKVEARSGTTGDIKGSLSGGFIKGGKYDFKGLGGLVAQTHYAYMNEYNWKQLYEILKKRGLAKNSVDTYRRNLEKIRNVKNPDTGEFMLPVIRDWSPQEFALALIRRLYEGWENKPPTYKKGMTSMYMPLLEALLFGMGEHPFMTPEMVELKAKYPYSPSKEKATIAALLVALNANKNDFVLENTQGYQKLNLIPNLKRRATFLQKQYHKEVQSKNPKEMANWVDWPKIVGRAKETIKEYNDMIEKKGLDRISASAYATWFNAIRKEKAAEITAKIKATGDKDLVYFLLSREYFAPYHAKMNKPFTTKILNALVAALYTELPPRRLDYGGGKLFVITQERMEEMCAEANEKETSKTENKQTEIDCELSDDEGVDEDMIDLYRHIWWVIPAKHNPFSSKSYLLFGRRAGKSPQKDELKVGNLPAGLRTLVGTYYSLLINKNDEWVEWAYGGSPLLVNAMDRLGDKKDSEGETNSDYEESDYKEITENGLGKRIKKIFSGKYGSDGKKNITASLLRKIYISHMFKGDTEKKVQLARLMNHSVKIQQHIYNKEGNITADDFLKIESNLVSAKKGESKSEK